MLTRRLVLAVGTAAVLVFGGATVALAADPSGNCPPDTLDCEVIDTGGGGSSVGSQGGNPGGSNAGGSASGGGQGSKVCRRGEEVVKCYDELIGWFNSDDGCYYKVAEPQPAGGQPGQIAYDMRCQSATEVRWFAAPPAGFEERASPAELAWDAFVKARVRMKPPVVKLAPDPSGAGLVGLPVWMWTSAGADTWGPISDFAEQAGLRVDITARVTGITWDMGDGSAPIRCPTPGTPYDDSYGAAPSPDCGYAGYQRPSRDARNGRYQVTATTSWQVTWSGGGQRDELPVQTRTSAPAAIRIDELQVVTR